MPPLLLFPAALTIHNTEEALLLPAWSHQTGKFPRSVTPGAFRFAVTVITLLAWGVTLEYMMHPELPIYRFCYTGFMGCMIVNTIFPHMAATIVTKSYCPGSLTGLFVLTPVCIFLLSGLLKEEIISFRYITMTTPGTGLVLLILLPLLFIAGQTLQRIFIK